MFLLLLLVLSGGLSIYYQLKLTAASENILKDNYESLSLIIGLTFAFNFPSVVVPPIERLMEAIRIKLAGF